MWIWSKGFISSRNSMPGMRISHEAKQEKTINFILAVPSCWLYFWACFSNMRRFHYLLLRQSWGWHCYHSSSPIPSCSFGLWQKNQEIFCTCGFSNKCFKWAPEAGMWWSIEKGFGDDVTLCPWEFLLSALSVISMGVTRKLSQTFLDLKYTWRSKSWKELWHHPSWNFQGNCVIFRHIQQRALFG